MPEPVARLSTASPPAAPDVRRRRAEVQQSAWLASFQDDGPVAVSVCIANWNCREMLRHCLESLHDYPQGVRLETIVVDNGSSDGAADMVAREFPEVILVRSPVNLGFARANNLAAGKARGRFLFFLNNDTVVPPGTLSQLVRYAEKNPRFGIIGPLLRDGHGLAQVSYRQRPTALTLLHRTSLLRWTGMLRHAYLCYRRQEFDPRKARQVDILMGAAMFLPREVFITCGRWDESFIFGGEDMDLSTRVGRRHPLVYLPEVEIIHYGRVSTRQHIGYASTNMAAGFARYLRKCGSNRWSLLAYKTIVSLDAPVQVLGKGIQYLWRRARGDRNKAEKSWLALQGGWHFLREGLVPFWKA